MKVMDVSLMIIIIVDHFLFSSKQTLAQRNDVFLLKS